MLKLETQQNKDVTIVDVIGEDLDIETVKDFKAALYPILAAHHKLVFDLSRIQFIDSSGLGVFLTCLRAVNSKGGDLKLCGLSKSIRAIFEIVRLNKIFGIFETREDAAFAFEAA